MSRKGSCAGGLPQCLTLRAVAFRVLRTLRRECVLGAYSRSEMATLAYCTSTCPALRSVHYRHHIQVLVG